MAGKHVEREGTRCREQCGAGEFPERLLVTEELQGPLLDRDPHGRGVVAEPPRHRFEERQFVRAGGDQSGLFEGVRPDASPRIGGRWNPSGADAGNPRGRGGMDRTSHASRFPVDG